MKSQAQVAASAQISIASPPTEEATTSTSFLGQSMDQPQSPLHLSQPHSPSPQ